MSPHARCSGAASYARCSKPMLEIIPDSRFLVFYGSEHEASPVKVSGVVRFRACESMSIAKPKVRLEGRRKITWYSNSNLNASEMTDKNTFYSDEQKLGGVESAHKVKAGVIDWPFEFELSPSMPESVEGLSSGYIGYHLHASVCRPGWNLRDLVASSHIRIVRTLGPESMEMPRSRINTDIWANKVAYSISTQSDVFVFGTSITADVELTPLRKGLEMGQIDIRLMEFVVKRLQLTEAPGSRERTKTEEKEVAREVLDFPQDSKVTYDDETPDNPTASDEMYRFQVHLPLPNSLNQCRQDVDSHQLQITHRFKIMISLHNPEGHVSQLVCRLPVKLFISPNLPVDDSNEVCARPQGLSDAALNANETNTTAPPQYGYHILDQLFSGLHPDASATRTPSLTNSASTNSPRSRSGSNGDMGPPSVGTNSEPRGQWIQELNGPSAEILESRLVRLQSSEYNMCRSQSLGSTDSGPSNTSSESSRRSSNDDPATAIQRRDYDMSNLSRVPSYGHALRCTGEVTPVRHVPPTYNEATERPSTPPPQQPMETPSAPPPQRSPERPPPPPPNRSPERPPPPPPQRSPERPPHPPPQIPTERPPPPPPQRSPERPPPPPPQLPTKTSSTPALQRPGRIYSSTSHRHSLDSAFPGPAMSQAAYIYNLRRLSGAQPRAIAAET